MTMTAAPHDAASPDLNLVFTEPSPAASFGTGGGGGRPKRKTKYDRRRERGRRAKLVQEEERRRRRGETREGGGSGDVGGGGRGAEGRETERRRPPSTPPPPSEAPAPLAVAPAVATPDAGAVAGRGASDGAGKANPAPSAGDDSTDRAPGSFARTDGGPPIARGPRVPSTRPTPSAYPAPVPGAETTLTPASRRRRVQSALTEEQRSQYLSEFHARPRDLDRCERASKEIKASYASDHIFGGGEDGTEDRGSEREDIINANEGDVGRVEEGSDRTAGDGFDPVSETTTNTNALHSPFSRLGLHPRLVSALTYPEGKFCLEQPTVVQSRSIAVLLGSKKGGGHCGRNSRGQKSERNLFIQSETGSGKTLAYMLPLMQDLAVDSSTGEPKRVDRQMGGTRSVVLCPTRELALQTYAIALNLSRASFHWIIPGCLSGGEKRKSEKARLRRGITVLVATPGRLLDHLSKTESLKTALEGRLEWLVLDEADRLLDAGLGSQVEEIVRRLKENFKLPRSGPRGNDVPWRSILVSATVGNDVLGFARRVLGADGGWSWARGDRDKKQDPSSQKITPKSTDREAKEGVKTRQMGTHKGTNGDAEEENAGSLLHLTEARLDSAAPRQLAQLYMVVNAKLRLSSLVAFLAARASEKQRTVVFFSTCDSVDYHHLLFRKMGSILDDDDGVDCNNDESRRTTNSREGIFGRLCPIYKIHGNMPHDERRSTLAAFLAPTSDRQCPAVLLATDVAARGLNLPRLDWIVQYDPPCELKDYVHRAGRAARAGRAGHAVLFLLPSERQYTEVLRLRGLQDISALSLSSILRAAAGMCAGVTREGESQAVGKEFSHGGGEAFTVAIQNRLEQCVIQDDLDYKALHEKTAKENSKERRKKQMRHKKDAVGPLLEGARKAFSAFVRAYPAKENVVRHIFNARALHLGHVARSLALRESPKMVSKGNARKVARGVGEKERALDQGKSQASGRGEKPVSGLAFRDKRLPAGTEDKGERKRNNLALLSAQSQHNKRPKGIGPSGRESAVQKRMMEAAMLMQAQEFM